MASPPDQHPLVRKLESITDLTPEERQALLDLPMKVQPIGANQDIVREGDRPSRCCLVLQGFVCRYKMTAPGKRQIMAFHISGDIPDLQSLHLTTLDHSLGTVTPCELGFIRYEDVRDLVRRWPRIGDMLWRDTLVDAAIFRAWMVGIGRREAYGRIAHLLCEVMTKLRAVGLGDGVTGIIRNFVCGSGMTGTKEPNHAQTQRTAYSGRHPGPASGWGRSQDGL